MNFCIGLELGQILVARSVVQLVWPVLELCFGKVRTLLLSVTDCESSLHAEQGGDQV